MAILRLEDGTTYTQLVDIARELAPLNINIQHWYIDDNSQLRYLLAKENLNEQEKEQVLTALDNYFKELQRTAGYQSRDLLVLHPLLNLDALLAKFNQIHIHALEEVRYIIDGEAIFGFVRPDATQVELIVQPEEYINVPAGTEHWFHLTAARRVKAVRYFSGTEGWIPEYTGRKIIFCSQS